MSALSRRSFILGAVGVPVAAKVAFVEGIVTPAAVPVVTSYVNIGHRTTMYATREMLRYVRSSMVMWKAGEEPPQPYSSADTVRFRRPSSVL